MAYSLLVVGPIWPSSVSVDAEFVGSSINNGINILLYWSKGKCASTIMDAVMDQSYIVCLQTPTIIDWPWVTMLMNIAIFARGQPGHYLKCVRTKLPELEFNFSPRCTVVKFACTEWWIWPAWSLPGQVLACSKCMAAEHSGKRCPSSGFPSQSSQPGLWWGKREELALD